MSRTMKEEVNNFIHPLGYDIRAPLPTMLDDDNVYTLPPKPTPESLAADPVNAELTLKLYDLLTDTERLTVDDKRKSIDEASFVRLWLPHLYGEETPDKPEEYTSSVINEWINEVAGNRYTMVNVIRDGKVIYRVPPVSGKLNIVGPNQRHTRISIMYNELEGFLNRLPSAAPVQISKFCQHLFDPKDPNMDSKQLAVNRNLKFIFVLDEIFTYYGYKSILNDKIMSIKPIVMGDQYVNRESNDKPKPVSVYTNPEDILDNDDDLWG